MTLRPDLKLIAAMVPEGARVLDLGWGDGALLAWLAAHRGVRGYGIEIDEGQITRCIARGVSVLERDIDEGLSDFPTDGFDVVVMAETLQAVRKPGTVLEHMLRIAPRSIVTFPNFGHWRCRLELASAGRMPIARHLPHAWHDTPNIHLCTFADFEALCAERSLTIYDRKVVNAHYERTWAMNHWPNLFGTIAVYGLSRPGA